MDRAKLHDNEIKMAVSLIENLSTDFEPAKYQDEHRQALWELIESKIVGKEVVAAAPAVDRGNVVDLMEALKPVSNWPRKLVMPSRLIPSHARLPGAAAKLKPGVSSGDNIP